MHIDTTTVKDFQSVVQEKATYTGHGKDTLSALKDAVDNALLFTPLDLSIADVRLEVLQDRVRLHVQYVDKYLVGKD